MPKEEMKKTTKRRKLCAVITNDIKNAFGSAPWKVIINEMKRLKIQKYLIECVQSYVYFKDRTIASESGETITIPQGSVIGTMVWNILYDSTLRLELPVDCYTVALQMFWHWSY